MSERTPYRPLLMRHGHAVHVPVRVVLPREGGDLVVRGDLVGFFVLATFHSPGTYEMGVFRKIGTSKE